MWHVASALIDETCGITGNHLHIVAGGSHGDRGLNDQGLWRGRISAHRNTARDDLTRHRRVPRLMSEQRNRSASHGTNLNRRAQQKTSPDLYEMQCHRGTRSRISIRMEGPDGTHIVWELASPFSPDGWNSEQLAMIENLLPHIRQFVRIRHALIGADGIGSSLAGLLDNMMIGTVCLDWSGIIIRSNACADALLASGDALLERHGVLRARQSSDDHRLRDLLANAVPRSGRPGVAGTMTVGRASRQTRLALHVAPVEVRTAGFSIGQAASLVLIADPEEKAILDPDHVAAALGLTPAESRIAVDLADGLTTKEIAVTTNRKESTVRELKKRIHSKLGISRRAHLVRMILSLSRLQTSPASRAPREP